MPLWIRAERSESSVHAHPVAHKPTAPLELRGRDLSLSWPGSEVAREGQMVGSRSVH